MTLVLVALAGFAAGVVVSQLGLVALVLTGRRILRRRARPRPSPVAPEFFDVPVRGDDAIGL